MKIRSNNTILTMTNLKIQDDDRVKSS